MINKTPYRNIERLWVRVHKFENNFYYGYIDNKPRSKAIKFNQYIKVHKNKVLEMQ